MNERNNCEKGRSFIYHIFIHFSAFSAISAPLREKNIACIIIYPYMKRWGEGERGRGGVIIQKNNKLLSAKIRVIRGQLGRIMGNKICFTSFAYFRIIREDPRDLRATRADYGEQLCLFQLLL